MSKTVISLDVIRETSARQRQERHARNVSVMHRVARASRPCLGCQIQAAQVEGNTTTPCSCGDAA